MKYHVEKNDEAFALEVAEIAKEFESVGDSSVAQYLMELVSNASFYVPQSNYRNFRFLKKVEYSTQPLLLPDVIEEDIIGITKAISKKSELSKFLFFGAPGSGKTESVYQISRLLNRDTLTVSFEQLIDSRLGETAKNVSLLFDEISRLPYGRVLVLFDEIDALVLDRINKNDLREMGRVTSVFLKELDHVNVNIAKALIIDAAAGWDYKTSTYKMKDLIGYGVVPININNVLETPNDEIRFVVYETSESYKTSNYTIPVPKDDDNNYPYVARATMCYFPECSRAQGVDYTNRELSLKFGRIKSDGSIADINDNVQDDDGAYIDERASRREFRKWENTKFISKILKRNRPLKSYDERLWGISVISKERLSTRVQGGLNFAAVVTLKEIKGVNRIQDFITACNLRGYIVNELNVHAQVNVYNANQEELIFE